MSISPNLPIRMKSDADAIAAAASDLASNGYCLLLMDENDDQTGLPSETSIIADHPLSAGALLRRRMAFGIITKWVGSFNAPLTFTKGAHGIPQVDGTPTALHLSFSARGSLGLVGIGITPIGVDLELPIPPEEIPLNILRDDERLMLERVDPEQRVFAFLRLWGAKEAMVKALGTGFSIPPEALTVQEHQVMMTTTPKIYPQINFDLLKMSAILQTNLIRNGAQPLCVVTIRLNQVCPTSA